MFRVDRRDGQIPTIELADAAGGALAELAPSRGGMLSRLRVRDRELLYLDGATFDDRSANVRGGVPVLFPSPGKLANDAWAWQGKRGAMKQHGFARNLPWEVAATATGSRAEVTLVLSSTPATLAQYPWDFEARFTYALSGATLRIEMVIENTGATEMPFGVGFHPYFAVTQAEKPRTRIATRATRAFDNVTKTDVRIDGIDLTAREVDLHLLDHGSTESSLSVEGEATPRAVVRGSPEFGRWVVWTLQGRDFVCLEPWTCPGDALNTGDGLLLLAPGATRSCWVEIVG